MNFVRRNKWVWSPFSRGQGFLVTIEKGKHLFPSRTEKLSPSSPMVLLPQGCGRVGRCQDLFLKVWLIYFNQTFFLGEDSPTSRFASLGGSPAEKCGIKCGRVRIYFKTPCVIYLCRVFCLSRVKMTLAPMSPEKSGQHRGCPRGVGTGRIYYKVAFII